MARGSGDHQVSTGSDDQGNTPPEYAAMSASGSRFPPTATSPFGQSLSVSSVASGEGGRLRHSLLL